MTNIFQYRKNQGIVFPAEELINQTMTRQVYCQEILNKKSLIGLVAR